MEPRLSRKDERPAAKARAAPQAIGAAQQRIGSRDRAEAPCRAAAQPRRGAAAAGPACAGNGARAGMRRRSAAQGTPGTPRAPRASSCASGRPTRPTSARLRDADAGRALPRLSRRAPGLCRQHRVLPRRRRRASSSAASTDLGVRVLSNLAEMDLENRHVLRILGLRLMQAGQPQLAMPVFRKVLELAPKSRSRTATSASPTPPTGSTRRRSTRCTKSSCGRGTAAFRKSS